jgi:hypothetical protein
MSDEMRNRVALAGILSTTTCLNERIENSKRMIRLSPRLQPSERNLVVDSFRAAAAAKRKGIQVLVGILERQRTKGRLDRAAKIEEQRLARVEEFTAFCNEFIGMIDGALLPEAERALEDPDSKEDPDSPIFYIRTKGDFIRYQCEWLSEPQRSALCLKANSYYENAMALLRARLPKPNALWLSVVLNHSVLLYELAKRPKDAIAIAQKVLQECEVLSESDKDYKEYSDLQLLLRQNISHWSQHDV